MKGYSRTAACFGSISRYDLATPCFPQPQVLNVSTHNRKVTTCPRNGLQTRVP